jgi:hypothetical protein
MPTRFAKIVFLTARENSVAKNSKSNELYLYSQLLSKRGIIYIEKDFYADTPVIGVDTCRQVLSRCADITGRGHKRGVLSSLLCSIH